MVTSGPLLPWWAEGNRECRYRCVTCGRKNVFSEQFVTFGPDDIAPAAMELPCYGAALDSHTGLQAVPVHLYVLAELADPAGDEHGGGSQGPTKEGEAHP
jgi:hypothetical protein